MVIRCGNFEIKPFKQFSIIQTKEDNQSIKHYTNINGNLVCAICGKEVESFEAIMKTTAIIGSDGEIKEIKAGDIMLVKPTKCSKCNSLEFIKTFIVNEDLYGQRIN
jgi:DNA-directed RNA polymerase subunit RPC12/RpoP